MPKPALPTTEISFVTQLNGNPYHASTNPYGMAAGGHRQNWPTAMNYTGDLAGYCGAVADFVDALADQVAQDAASAAAGSGTEASVADIRAGAAAEYISIRHILEANIRVTLDFGTPLAWDMASGINFRCTLTGNTTLPNATDKTVGKSGFIDFVQDGTGGREVDFTGSDYVWIGGPPDWNILPNGITKIAYYVAAPNQVQLIFAGNSI